MPYTSHGHWYGRGEPGEPGPAAVARCGGPGMCPRCNQEACTEGFHGGQDTPGVTCPSCGTTFQAPQSSLRVTESAAGDGQEDGGGAAAEAMIDGERSFDDTRELVRKALRERAAQASGLSYAWVYISDLTATQVVFASGDDELFQCSFEVADDGEVTLGDPMRVVRTYAPPPSQAAPAGELETVESEIGEGQAVESRDTIVGRVVEAKGTGVDGGRIFRVRIIEYGDSKNGRRYSETVMRTAAGLYEGSKCYDHHRTEAELKTGTIAGLVGYFREVAAEADGLYADLHLLPSAKLAAEALDATLAAQEDELPPLIGLSHDVYATFKAVTEGGRRIEEATAITRVNSADLVSDPAAGGKATRMVANEGISDSGTEPDREKEGDVPPTKEDILSALREASDEDLAAVGLAKAAQESGPVKDDKPPAPAPETKVTETGEPKTGFLGRLLIKAKVEDAGLPASVVESLTEALPDRIVEADVDAQIASIKAGLAIVERADLAPKTTVTVTRESREKKVAALDAFFAGKFSEGFHSFRQAFVEITGRQPKSWDEDFSRTILRESFGPGFDSGVHAAESLDSTSWAQVLGDSVTRRLVAMYQLPGLQNWREIVSNVVPVNDFREQKVGRVGGYGVLPTVSQGAPYQPLTSPPDEEATYSINKRGGTEDLTLEMIANDDVRAIAQIPNKLGRAAAQTLYRFVWDFLRTNATCTYDATALFHANHNNTANPALLSESTLSAARVAMRRQVAYGDNQEILSFVPRHLVVPSTLETLAFKLSASAVAITSTEDATTPNIHRNLNPIVVDYFTDDNDWFAIANPSDCPTIEVGFYLGRQDPELFTQADANQGSMFNADKMTLKIRHIYSGTVLDHRGFYRGANA